MRRWISYLALLVAAFSIWFGTTHWFAAPAQNQAWLAKAGPSNQITGTTAVGNGDNGVNSAISPSIATNQTAQAHAHTGNEPAPASTSKHTSSAATGNVQLDAGVASPNGANVSSKTSASPGAAGAGSAAGNSTQGSVSGQTVNTTAPTANTTAPVAPTATNLGSFTIRVTLQHGATLEAERTVGLVPGESLMWYMTKYFHVTTIDGGAFLVGINGINSQWTGVPVAQRQPVDWFLYVNQQLAPVGAASITPRSGDIDVWDYHSWNPSTGKG